MYIIYLPPLNIMSSQGDKNVNYYYYYKETAENLCKLWKIYKKNFYISTCKFNTCSPCHKFHYHCQHYIKTCFKVMLTSKIFY